MWVSKSQAMTRDASYVLKTEAVKLIATHKVVVQVVVQLDESDSWMGTDQTVAWGTVSMLYGFDLKNVEISEREDSSEIVSVPLPQVLSAELEDDTVQVIRKATIAQRLKDFGDDNANQIRKLIKTRAQDFASHNGLFPSLDDTKSQLQTILDDFDAKATVQVIEPLS